MLIHLHIHCHYVVGRTDNGEKRYSSSRVRNYVWGSPCIFHIDNFRSGEIGRTPKKLSSPLEFPNVIIIYEIIEVNYAYYFKVTCYFPYVYYNSFYSLKCTLHHLLLPMRVYSSMCMGISVLCLYLKQYNTYSCICSGVSVCLYE